MAGRTLKHDGLAEVIPIRYIHQGPTSGKGWLVVINHYEEEPEIWGEYINEDNILPKDHEERINFNHFDETIRENGAIVNKVKV